MMKATGALQRLQQVQLSRIPTRDIVYCYLGLPIARLSGTTRACNPTRKSLWKFVAMPQGLRDLRLSGFMYKERVLQAQKPKIFGPELC